ncbi:GNAT family N-acetyltransferase [Psychrobacter sp. I-STPA10]|uniref:GNAT family N-acetyltransferase n=1 Tax=Psychrobacter sp. I-STPA10 TaxID=2585769 RepID=UPI001E5D39C4|nr:GNAT family N-acetyltransferase [Psychrobacter sp. I-STPA10]
MQKSLKITHNDAASRFEATIDGLTAYISYQEQGDDTLIYDHTIVPKELEGRGIGSALVKNALDYAHATHKSVIPQCSFVAAYIKRHPKYQDLLV